MPPLDRRLYISDLDGTLLQRDRSLGTRTRRVLERFIAAGGLFTVATGRSAASCASTLGGLRLPLPAITHNGALVVDLQSGSASAVTAMQGGQVARLFQAALQRGLCPVAYVLETGLEAGSIRLLHGAGPNRPTRRYLDSLAALHPITVDDGGRLAALPGLSLILLDEPARLAELFEEACAPGSGLSFSLGRSAYTPGLGVGEVQAEAASKGAAARQLAASLGLGESEVVAFGDNCNDLPLLRLAGRAFCPPDSQPEVLAAVTGRIACAAEEGVADYLEALLDGVAAAGG